MIEITLPWPDKRLSPNSRCHWREKAEAAKIAKEQGYMLTLHALEEYSLWVYVAIPDLLAAHFIFYPPDKRKRDIDNFHSMQKNIMDGVCEVLRIDDSRIKRTILEWGEVVKGGKVVLTLEEMK